MDRKPSIIIIKSPATSGGSWEAISKADGVTLAMDFGSPAEVDPNRFANASSAAQFNELIKRVTINRHASHQS